LATIAYTIVATVGVDYGLPGQVATRMVYGMRGAKWVLRRVTAVSLGNMV